MRILYVKATTTHPTGTVEYLADNGVIVESAFDGIEALAYLDTLEFDGIVISEPVADMTAPKLVRLIRANKVTTPILVRADDGCGHAGTAIDALNAGADDYCTTCSNPELEARLQALARRANGKTSDTLEIGDITLDLTNRSVWRGTAQIHLTNKEYAMFEVMAMRRGCVISKDQFLSHLYRDADEPEIKILDVFACKLRKKLGYDVISNVWGRGYMIPAAPVMLKTERKTPSPEDRYNLVESNWSTTPL